MVHDRGVLVWDLELDVLGVVGRLRVCVRDRQREAPVRIGKNGKALLWFVACNSSPLPTRVETDR